VLETCWQTCQRRSRQALSCTHRREFLHLWGGSWTLSPLIFLFFNRHSDIKLNQRSLASPESSVMKQAPMGLSGALLRLLLTGSILPAME